MCKGSIAAILMGLIIIAPSSAVAQSGQCGIERKVTTKALDEATWKQLNKAYERVGEDEYQAAYEMLLRVGNRAGKDKYLRGVVAQATAQVEWLMENYDAALKNFEIAVEMDALPNQAHFALMYQIAQLYFMKERYDDALVRLDTWFCHAPKEKITSSAHVLKASIYAQKEDYSNTIKAIQIAIDMAEDPKEQWFQLKLASHYELEQFPQAADTLALLIQHWTDKKLYWIQLSQTYYKLKQEKESLSVLALAHRKGLLDKQSDLLFLSSMLANAEVPYKAADVLQQGIEDGIVEGSLKHWSAVADSWYNAEELEKALIAYQKAGEVSTNGKIDLRRGYILVDLERWDSALEAMDATIGKGGLRERETGEAYLLRGMAEFSLGNYNQASSDWSSARMYKETREAAQQWLNHLKEERRRRAP